MKRNALTRLTSLMLASMLIAQPVLAESGDAAENTTEAAETVEETAEAAEEDAEITEETAEDSEDLSEELEEEEEYLWETPDSYAVEAKDVPYLYQFNKFSEPGYERKNLYFINGGDIPYVSLDEFMPFMSELLGYAGKKGIVYNVESTSDSLFTVVREDNESIMYIDTEEDTILFLNKNSFTNPVGSKAAVTISEMPEPDPVDLEELAEWNATVDSLYDNADTEGIAELLGAMGIEVDTVTAADGDEAAVVDEEEVAAAVAGDDEDGATVVGDDEDVAAVAGEDAAEHNLFACGVSDGIYYNRMGSPVEFNLKDYMIDLVSVDGVCYLPMQTMADIFFDSEYIHFVYTGKTLLVFADGVPLADDRFEMPVGTFSEEFANFNYNELRFMLDTFYGLKPEHNIEDFGTLMSIDTDLGEDLAGTDPRKFDMALMQLVNMYFDDGHSGYSGGSVLSGETDPEVDRALMKLTLGPAFNTMFDIGERFENARSAVYGDNVPYYEEVGDTAFITFDEFAQDRSDDAYYELDPDAPVSDTIELVIYANRQIKREDSPIKNIVIDLSNNGGGDAPAAVYILSWLLGNAQIAVRDTLTGAQTNAIYQCDVNLDGVFTPEDDTVANGYNLYCLTCVNSFSCGNLVPAACRESGKVTLVGQTSGGGSCVVFPATTASGALFQISGPSQLSLIKNGSFYNIDQGIEPDVKLNKPESFYDRPALVEYLNELK